MNNAPDIAAMTSQERDRRVLELCEQVSEIEQRLIPTGLHVFGRATDGRECADMLRMVASFDRPEVGVRSLPDLVAEGLGFDASHLFHTSTIKDEGMLRTREQVDVIVREAISIFIHDGVERAVSWLGHAARVAGEASRPVLMLLERIREQLKSNQELDSLMRALRGEYIAPGPGADIVQNPGILPTGRNTHAVNPYKVPSEAAFTRAERVVNLLLKRHRAEHGRYPHAMALVLW
nr:cobaltochelatase subunit CobN [Pyrinomonadaceae bacterium]